MRKLTALLLAVVMVLAIAPAFSFAEEGETRVVTLATYSDIPAYWVDSVENVVLKDKYGIVLEHTYSPTDKMGVMLASGDIPDIVKSKQQYISTIMTNKMALNLDEHADKLPWAMSDLYKAGADLFRLCLGGEDHVLYFSGVSHGAEYSGSNDKNVRGYIVRWDLYKEIGAPEIHNDEDFIAAMQKMVELYPETEDGQKVYGMGMYDSLGAWCEFGRYKADVATRPAFSGYRYEASIESDAELIDGYTNIDRSAFWASMKFFNKVYNAGLLDPDSFTMTSTERSEKIKANQYVTAYSRDEGMYNANLANDPSTLAGFVMIPSEAQVIHADYLTPTGFAPSNVLWINANAQHLDDALTVFDYWHDPETSRMTYNGIQGKHWDYDENGKPYIFDEVLAAKDQYGYGTEEFLNATGILCNTTITINCSTGTAPDGFFYNIMEEQNYRASVLTNLDRDFANFYGYETPSAYHTKLIDDGTCKSLINEMGMLVCMGIDEIPLDIQRIMTSCEDILYAAMSDLVMAESDEEFESIQEDVLAELADAGEAEAWDWCKTHYDASMEVVRPSFEAYQADYIANVVNKR